jgi:hypothetical protein
MKFASTVTSPPAGSAVPSTSTLDTTLRGRDAGIWEWRRPVLSCLMRVEIRLRLSCTTDMCVIGSASSEPAGTQYRASSVHSA